MSRELDSYTYGMFGHSRNNMSAGYHLLAQKGSLITLPSAMDIMRGGKPHGFPLSIGGDLHQYAVELPRRPDTESRQAAGLAIQSGFHPGLGELFGISLAFSTPLERAGSVCTMTFINQDPGPRRYILRNGTSSDPNDRDVALALFEEVMYPELPQDKHPLYNALYVARVVSLSPITSR